MIFLIIICIREVPVDYARADVHVSLNGILRTLGIAVGDEVVVTVRPCELFVGHHEDEEGIVFLPAGSVAVVPLTVDLYVIPVVNTVSPGITLDEHIQ